MIRVAQLNHVALGVKDVGRTVSFYERVLGLKQIPRPAFNFPGAWFRLGSDQELHIIEVPADTPAPDNASRGNHFALRVESIEESRAQLDVLGVTYRGPHRRPDGATQIFFPDPDGHLIELCAAPAPLAARREG